MCALMAGAQLLESLKVAKSIHDLMQVRYVSNGNARLYWHGNGSFYHDRTLEKWDEFKRGQLCKTKFGSEAKWLWISWGMYKEDDIVVGSQNPRSVAAWSVLSKDQHRRYLVLLIDGEHKRRLHIILCHEHPCTALLKILRQFRFERAF